MVGHRRPNAAQLGLQLMESGTPIQPLEVSIQDRFNNLVTASSLSITLTKQQELDEFRRRITTLEYQSFLEKL